jgi:hypothetical protein
VLLKISRAVFSHVFAGVPGKFTTLQTSFCMLGTMSMDPTDQYAWVRLVHSKLMSAKTPPNHKAEAPATQSALRRVVSDDLL